MGSYSFSDEFLTSTAWHALEGARDVTDKSRPARFLDDMLSMGTDPVSGGHKIKVDFQFGEHASTTRLSSGYEPISLTANPLGSPGFDDWALVVRPVLISQKDEDINQGEKQIISLVEQRTMDSDKALRRQAEIHFLQGGVTEFADFNTVNGTDIASGLIEQDVFGSQANTIHGHSRTGGNQLQPYFQNQIGDVGGSFSTIGLRTLYALQTELEQLYDDPSKVMGYASSAFLNNLKRATEGREIYQSSDPLDPGRRVAQYGGMKFRPTSRLPQSGATTTGDPWSCLFVDWEGLRLQGMKDRVFSMSEFKTISGHDVRAAFFRFMGQLILRTPATQALVFDAEAW